MNNLKTKTSRQLNKIISSLIIFTGSMIYYIRSQKKDKKIKNNEFREPIKLARIKTKVMNR